MPSGPNSGSPNSASGRAVGRWRVPHDDWTLGANHVSRAPESGWPIPLLLISGLATGPPAGVGDGLRVLSRHCQHVCPRSGRFRLYELRVSRTFLDFLRLICSVHGYPTQGAANTSCPSSDRFRLRELRESQHFSTFYGPSVQSMDTQLGARQRGADPGGSPRSCSTFREGGLEGRREWNPNRPVSRAPAGVGRYRDLIRESFEKQ